MIAIGRRSKRAASSCNRSPFGSAGRSAGRRNRHLRCLEHPQSLLPRFADDHTSARERIEISPSCLRSSVSNFAAICSRPKCDLAAQQRDQVGARSPARPASNEAPSIPLRDHTLRHARRVRPPSKVNMKFAGTSFVHVTCRHAPLFVRLWTTQSTPNEWPIKKILASFSTHVRRAFRLSSMISHCLP